VALRRGLEVDPTHYVSHLPVGLVCLQKNLANEAIEAMRQAVMHSGGGTDSDLSHTGMCGSIRLASTNQQSMAPRRTPCRRSSAWA
jgi:hypothetical protein